MFWKKPPSPGKSGPAKLSRDELIAQAKATAAAAREEIGEETLSKIREVLLAQEKQKQQKQQKPAPSAPLPKKPKDNSPAARARELIETMDKAKVADYIRTMSREDDA